MAADDAPWVDGLTIGAALERTAERYPNLDACVFSQLDAAEKLLPEQLSPAERRQRSLRLSYRQLDADVDRVAKGLLALGIGKGDHVAVWATNWPNWIRL